jgi:hypothetical protein
MKPSMKQSSCALLAMTVVACGVVDATPGELTSTAEQSSVKRQGMEMQGMEMQGMEMQGMEMQGMRLEGVTMSGDTLRHVRVVKGELFADRGSNTLRGTQLIGARLEAQVRNVSVNPPTSAVAQYRITDIDREDDRFDPTGTRNTYLYTLEQFVPDDNTWRSACPADDDGRRVAIPIAAIWDERGNRIESSTMFTFGCTTGVIAKCYRWGYRPWVTGYGDLVSMHQTCTRVARADYCGNGVSHTRNGTSINIWDRLPPPGPIQRHGFLPPLGFWFEAGWNTGGAVCMSTARWLLDDGLALAQLCPDRLVPPGLLLPTVCDTITAVFLFDPNAKIFNESNLLNILDP